MGGLDRESPPQDRFHQLYGLSRTEARIHLLVQGSPLQFGGRLLDATPVSSPLPVALPAAPLQLTARAYASNSIYLTWIGHREQRSGFQVERSTNAVDWVQIERSVPTTNYFNSAGVTAGIMYSYRIRSYNTGKLCLLGCRLGNNPHLPPRGPHQSHSLVTANCDREPQLDRRRPADGFNWVERSF